MSAIRKIFAVLVLTAYTVLLCRPFVPYLNYELNKEYIKENLCINRDKPEMHCEGKCYLQSQIQKEMQQQEQKEPLHSSTLEAISVHQSIAAYEIVYFPEEITVNFPECVSPCYAHLHHTDVFNPPRFV